MTKFDDIDAMVELERRHQERVPHYIKAQSVMLVEIQEYLKQGKSIESILGEKERQLQRYAEHNADPEQTQMMIDVCNKLLPATPPWEDVLAVLDLGATHE